MSLLRSVYHWLKSQSDLTHNGLVVAATSAAIPAVMSLKAPCTAFINLSTVSVMFGTQNWVSWVAGPTMFINMERHKFGDIQARLFPKLGMAGMIGIFVGYLFLFMLLNVRMIRSKVLDGRV